MESKPVPAAAALADLLAGGMGREPAAAAAARAELLAEAARSVQQTGHGGRYLACGLSRSAALDLAADDAWTAVLLGQLAGVPGPYAGVLIDMLVPRAGPVDLDPEEIAWAEKLGAPELAWVIDAYGVLHDPLLAERMAELLVRRSPGVFASAARLGEVLEELASEFRDERPNLEPSWIFRAVRVASRRGPEQLSRALAASMAGIRLGGRVAVVLSQKWEVMVLRRFMQDHEERVALEGVPAAELEELYPQLGTDFVVRASIRKATSMEGSRTPHAALHLLEKCPSCTASASPASIMCSTAPTAPPCHRSEGEDKPVQGMDASVAAEHDLGEVGLGMKEAAELAQVQAQAAARKAMLLADGHSLRAAKQDPELAGLIHKANTLRRMAPCIAEAIAAAARARSEARVHIPVLLSEAVDGLVQSPTARYVDCTFGRGGHSRAVLLRLEQQGALVAFDLDPDAVSVGERLAAEDPRFSIVHRPFSELVSAVSGPIAGVLLDLGVSSPQLDDTARGFSSRSKKDGPLDMRMNPEVGLSAAEWLQTARREELINVLATSGHSLDARTCKRVAAAVAAQQRVTPFRTTRALASFLESLGLHIQAHVRLPQWVFTSMRVFLNREMSQLDQVLEGAFERLAFGGRVVLISFIKWEFVMLRRFLRDHEEPSPALSDMPAERLAELYPLLASGKDFAVRRVGRPRGPGPAELLNNPRSNTALLHVLEKVPRHLGGRHGTSVPGPRGALLAPARFRAP